MQWCFRGLAYLFDLQVLSSVFRFCFSYLFAVFPFYSHFINILFTKFFDDLTVPGMMVFDAIVLVPCELREAFHCAGFRFEVPAIAIPVSPKLDFVICP